MMTKFFLGIAIVAFTTFCGAVLAKKYRQRKLFFKQLKEFNERFLNEISYYRRPLGVFSQKYSYTGEFKEVLYGFLSIMDKSIITSDTLHLSVYTFLQKDDLIFIEDYFKMLGKGDSASQKTYFNSIKEPLTKLQTESEATCKKYGDLYIKIGFLCGLLILILIL